MSFHFSPKIITDGLVLYLDAANTKSFVSGGTIWNDISKTSTNINLINGPSFNNSNYGTILFDGINDYAQQNTPLDTGQNVTVSAWVYRNNTSRGGIFTNSYPFSPSKGWYFLFTNNSSLGLSVGSDQSFIIAQNNSVPTSRWSYITGTISSGKTSTLYSNGLVLPLSANAGTPINIIYDTNWKVGALLSFGTNDYLSARVGMVQIYNRVLSQEEIQQNYNTTKSRFGL